MVRFVIGLFLIAHGLVHLLYLAPRPKDDPSYPFVPEDRWLPRLLGLEPGTAKAIAAALAVATAIVFLVAGIAVIADATIAGPAAIVGAGLSLVLLLAFFHPWLSIGVAIDVAIIVTVVWLQVPTSLFDG
jgi:hypothetical protein